MYPVSISGILTLCVPCVVTNCTNKQTNKMYFSYVFILQFLVQLYMFRKIISFIIRSFVVYYIYSSVQTVQTCLTVWSCKTKHLTAVCVWILPNYNFDTTKRISSQHGLWILPRLFKNLIFALLTETKGNYYLTPFLKPHGD